MSRRRHAPRLILGIETSSRLIGVALVRGDDLIASVEECMPQPQGRNMRGAVERLLHEARAPLNTIDGVAVSQGPGSFTGVRIGISFVKGLALERHWPVVGVPTLEAIARNAWGARGTVCVLVDARQGKIYMANFRMAPGRCVRVGQERLGTIRELSSDLKRGTLFLGDGLMRYTRELERLLKRPMHAAPQPLWWPRATMVAYLGARLLARGRQDDPATLTPQYLYPNTCSINANVFHPRDQIPSVEKPT